MMAIGSEYRNSARSNTLLINSPGSRFSSGQMLDSTIVDFESWEASDQTDLKVSYRSNHFQGQLKVKLTRTDLKVN